MKEKLKLPSFLLEHIPWKTPVDPIWAATAFVLHRNLAAYPFPSKIEKHQVGPLLDTLKKTVLSLEKLEQPLFIDPNDMAPLDKEYLFEHFFCLEGFQNTSKGQGFVVDQSNQFLALLNIQDHLQISLIDYRGEWEKSWTQFSNLETAISKEIEFAYSPKFGYLTSDPSLCGTGLTILVYLHLPALIHAGEWEDLLIKQKDEDIFVTSIEGSLDEIPGDLVVFSNQYTLGLTEENILHSVHLCAMKFITAEKKLRSQLLQDKPTEMKDRVSRAYGLLIHSYQLQIKETLNALSLIKLGVDLNWIKGIADSKVNEIFLKSHRAHLTYFLHETSLDVQELSRKRAEYIQKELQGIELLL